MDTQDQVKETRLSMKKLVLFFALVSVVYCIQLSSQESYEPTQLLIYYPDAKVPYKEMQSKGYMSNYDLRNKRSRKLTSFMPMRGRKDGRELLKFRIPHETILLEREGAPSRQDHKSESPYSSQIWE